MALNNNINAKHIEGKQLKLNSIFVSLKYCCDWKKRCSIKYFRSFSSNCKMEYDQQKIT